MPPFRILFKVAAAGIGAQICQLHVNKQRNDTVNKENEYSRLKALSCILIAASCQRNAAPTFTARGLIRKFNTDGQSDEDEDDDDSDESDDEDDDYEVHRITGGGNRPAFWLIPVFRVHLFVSKPTRSYFMLGDDCRVYFDTRTKTPFWTVEKIKKDCVGAVQHRHCEEFKINCNLPGGFRYGFTGNYAKFDVNSVEIPLQTRQARIGPGDKPVYVKQEQCDFCLNRHYWHIFNEYLAFLTEIYDEVAVSSGVIYKPKHGAGNFCNGFTLDEVDRTHYFKVITCKNADGTYRYECYKFAPLGRVDVHRSLMEYSVSRAELEADIGFTMFDNILPNMVKECDTRTHPDFVSH